MTSTTHPPKSTKAGDCIHVVIFFSLKHSENVRNLEVFTDANLNRQHHIPAITKTALYHLKKHVSTLGSFLSQPDSEKLLPAFISSRLDDCAALFVGLPKSTIGWYQLMQNAAGQSATWDRTIQHMTHVLNTLHWLLVQHRIDFIVLLLVYKAINVVSPKYLSDLLTGYSPGRSLRSSVVFILLTKTDEICHQWHSMSKTRWWSDGPGVINTNCDYTTMTMWQ